MEKKDRQPEHERWAARARYDLRTAQAMFKSGRWLYVLFCCQQAVEKMIKSIIIKKTGELAPRSHDLTRLAGLAELETSEDQRELLLDLTNYYIESRYPDQISKLSARVSSASAKDFLKQTKEIMRWLSSTA